MRNSSSVSPAATHRASSRGGVSGRPDAERGATESLHITNLFNTLPELARLSLSALERGAWLDAYLFGAGISQLIDDHLQRDTLSLRRLGAYLATDGGRFGGMISRRLTVPAARVLDRIVGAGPAAYRARRIRRMIAPGLDRLADLAAGAHPSLPESALEDLRRRCESLSRSPRRVPRALREDLVRLPACFRSFDQHPDDVGELVRRFAAAHPDRRQPLLVVGVRTSGSYLAPLCAACLRAEGFTNVDVITMRPGLRVPAGERAIVRSCVLSSGLVLVCDDPPQTGAAIGRVAAELRQRGVPGERIVLLLALFPGTPPDLAGHEAILLPFEDWSIHRRLRPEAVARTLARLLGRDRDPPTVELVRGRPPRRGRGHLKAVYKVTLADGDELNISVEGVGLGYFGAHAGAVAPALAQFLPAVFGVDDGLLFRAWLPDAAAAGLLPATARGAITARVARYVFARSHALAIPSDVSLRQGGQYPAWEAASTLLSRPIGRAWPIGRSLVTNRVVKRLVRVTRPCVVDGNMDLSRWFAVEGPATMVKVDWDQGGSSNLGLGCCDAVFDLAGVAAASQDVALADELRDVYEALDGARVDEERWLLHQFAHLAADPGAWGSDRLARRAAGRALQHYFGRVYFADLPLAVRGPLCAIDLDGVLEADGLGFPSMTPASAIALRALRAHGYRPVIVTGRSLEDVVERCGSYGLSGGVAEYGAAVYQTSGGRTTVLTTPQERVAMGRLRAELAARAEVTLDQDFRHAVRAFVVDTAGVRRPLPERIVADAQRAAAAEATRVIDGYRQTDLVPDSVDKGRGLRRLAAALAEPIAFAVGDTAADEPMLALAERAFVPAHASGPLRARFVPTRRPYQRGFAEAVGRLIGHDPGGCPRCRLPPPSRERRALLGLLGMRDAGMRGLPWRLLKLAARP
jgi:hydroxymethylpyrimidine pyrophosphatase-like HAD family hydrolase